MCRCEYLTHSLYRFQKLWNGYKKGVIRVDTWNRVEDVSVKDCSSDNVTIVTVYSSGKIRFNQNVMDELTDTQRQATIEHEIGHALGIGHTKASGTIMRQGVKNYTKLHKLDKEAYDAAYKEN